MLSSIPPPNTHTPASLASCTTACAAAATAGSSSAAMAMAALGNEIRYLVIADAPSGTAGCPIHPCRSLGAHKEHGLAWGFGLQAAAHGLLCPKGPMAIAFTVAKSMRGRRV